MRRPGDRLADGIVTHVERTPVDVDRAVAQWEQYVATLAGDGWDIVEVPPAPHCPDAVFIEDAVVVFRDVAVVCRPGAPERRPETEGLGALVASMGYDVRRIEAPGTLDGGDVLEVGDTVYVGRSGRTDEEGIRQLAAIVEPLGARVVPVPLTKALHLKSAVTALPDGTVIGYESLLDDTSVFPSFFAVPEETGAHVVLLGDDRVLIAADAPRTSALIEARGFVTVPVDISEFVKLEGCVTCLSVRLRRPPGVGPTVE